MLSLLCVYAIQGSHGEKGKLGLLGVTGDMVGIHYLSQPVGTINLIIHI